jgi:alpha-N-arabinofuranosidase
MRQIDPSVRLVACGSSGPEMPWFGTWERIVLEEAYDQVDYISAHAYYQEKDGDLASFLASGASMDRYIADVVATADHVRAAGRHTKRMAISFDEWNVWYQDRQRPAASWDTGTPRLEDRYTVADAVVVGSMLIALVRNSDRVLSANLAQLVNVIAPIRTEPGGRAWRQTTFHPFAEMARGTRGTVLGTILTTPSHDTPTHGEVPTIDAVAVLDEAAATARIFAVNRSVDEPVRLRVDARDLGVVAASARTIGGENLYAVADADSAATFGLRSVPQVSCDGARVTATLLPASWTSLALALR